MNKLKTLKDMKLSKIAINSREHQIIKLTEERIKQEAIKWVKLIKSGKKIQMEDVVVRPVILYTWIKYFFNIAEEDLK